MLGNTGSPSEGKPAKGSTAMQTSSKPPGQPVRRIEVKQEEPAGFERILADVAGRLSNVAEGKFDEVVTGCLRTLVEHLGFDRSSLMAFSDQGNRFTVTHSWAIDGVPAATPDLLLNSKMPWVTHQIRCGHIVSVSSSVDLPSSAVQERAYLLQSGLKSTLAVPLLMEGTIIGAMGFGSFRVQKHFTPVLVTRLRLAGEVMAMGMRRHQYAQGLQDIAQAMAKVSDAGGGPGARLNGKPCGAFRERALRLMQAEHQERRRMGQVLHEDVMQVLSAVTMLVQSGESDALKSPGAVKAVSMLREALGKMRQLTLELRPDAVFQMTLADGIRWMAGQMRRRYDLDVELRIDDSVSRVDGDTRGFLYDSAFKLLENVAVHSSSKRAVVEVHRVGPETVQLAVSDEGVGFNPPVEGEFSAAGYGLASIREQAELLGGSLDVTSTLGRGTKAVVTVPNS